MLVGGAVVVIVDVVAARVVVVVTPTVVSGESSSRVRSATAVPSTMDAAMMPRRRGSGEPS